MDLFKAMGISASGLRAQRLVMNAISMNLANVHTTRSETGEPYRRIRAIFSHVPTHQPFSNILLQQIEVVDRLMRTHPTHFPQAHFLPWEMNEGPGGIKVELVEDLNGYKMIHDPSHPDANESGYVLLPNINIIDEMIELLGAVRSYEANVTAFNAAKSMGLKALEIGR
jgi:flagellar basal-body rod protein FlgC